ncbi:amidase [Leptolyngbya sp. FACHB-711]|uniref:amidase n=1 Tax=Leptolyngbya sp. FACHB-711 TaxID=2692813 RepID=UPI0016858AA8|nr:amidase [Leptolyngbya sp. FACHB-711]MBD1852600.1 amidase [Cyanobacteria bacterium FACHB-502]MBD2025776.1 amidase [Leptolyngbya sp. FACHB-711]
MTAIHQLTATQLAQAIRNRQIRAVEAVGACFEQIDRLNDRLKAMITLCRERAEAEAIQADAAIDRGEWVGALHGVPFTVKDLTPTADVRTTFGSPLYRDYVPQQDELCVARLRFPLRGTAKLTAGGILIGKTNTPEFGMGTHCTNALYGPTANPYDPDRSSGGSSGGAAVAVCTGMSYLAQGTDMGGSCRTPASFCGIVGLRPSAGRIPRRRKPLLWDFLDTDGILARTVEDAALMLSVMAGADDRDPLSRNSSAWTMPDFSSLLRSPVRLAFSPSLGIATIDSEVEAVFQQAIAQIAAHLPVKAAHPDCSMATFAFETLRAATLLHKQKYHYEKYSHLLSESVRWNIERGIGISAADLLQAEADRDRLYLNFLRFFESYDILATVTASIPPYLHTELEILEINGIPMQTIIDYLTITYTISLTGLPAVSIPCGWTSSGLPIGMQLVGKPGGEAALLQFAYFLQETLNFRHRWV